MILMATSSNPATVESGAGGGSGGGSGGASEVTDGTPSAHPSLSMGISSRTGGGQGVAFNGRQRPPTVVSERYSER